MKSSRLSEVGAFVALGFLACACVGAVAAPITNWVAVTGTPQGDGSKANPFDLYTGYTNLSRRTSQKDVLMIQPGTYHLSQIYPAGTTRMKMTARNWIHEINGSTGNPKDVIIDGDGTCGFCAAGTDTYTFRLRDITLTNCYNAGKGGAIQNDSWSNGGTFGDSCTVSNCIFRSCRSANAGGGAYLRQAIVDNCLFENCTVTNESTSTAHEYHAEGGGLDIQYNGGKVTRSIFRNCSVTCLVAGRSQVGGGGLNVTGDSASLIEDCWIENCHVYEAAEYEGWAGGGIRGGSTMRHTMVTNCSSRISYGAVANAPKMIGCTVTKCRSAKKVMWRNNLVDTLVEDNVATNGEHIVSASGWCYPSYHGSVFRKNSAKGQVVCNGFAYNHSGGNAATISNCVFTLNENTANNGGILGIDNTPSITIADCIFTKEKPKSRGIIEIGMSTLDTRMTGLMIRNCFFEKIGTYCNYVYVNQSGAHPVKLENCSFIQKQNTGVIGFNQSGYQTAFSAANCLFYSYNRKYLNTFFATASTVTNSVFVWDNAYATTAPTDINLAAEYGNSEYYYTSAGFRDPANGDYRLKKNSPLVDRSAQPDWAAYPHRKKGTADMGDGTWSEKPAARVTACVGLAGIEKTFDVGVKVGRNKPHPRVANGKIDVGCFEYWTPPGLVLLVR